MHNSFIFQQYICYTLLLNMFRAARCSSSGGPIVSPQPLVSSPSVSSCTVCRWRAVHSPPAYCTAAYRGWRHQRLWWYNWSSWGWAASCSKHVEESSVTYTGCHRRNGPNFGRLFLMLNYTDITQNTYIQSWTVKEIMAWEKCGHLAFPRTVRLQLCSALTWREHRGTHFCDSTRSAQRDKIAFHYCRYVQCLVTLRTTVTWVRMFL